MTTSRGLAGGLSAWTRSPGRILRGVRSNPAQPTLNRRPRHRSPLRFSTALAPATIKGTMGDQPRGTVTFLFTDIEGSTELVRKLGERYVDTLAEHRQLVRAAFAEHEGGRSTRRVTPSSSPSIASEMPLWQPLTFSARLLLGLPQRRPLPEFASACTQPSRTSGRKATSEWVCVEPAVFAPAAMADRCSFPVQRLASSRTTSSKG